MEQDDKAVWNRKYTDEPGRWREPDPFLVHAYETFLKREPPLLALDVAGGAGRHAIWLASRGWHVKIVDVSEVGLQLACQNAARTLGSAHADEFITTETTDLDRMDDLGHELYDLVLVFRYLNRRLFPALNRTLKAGGTLIYSTYTTAQHQFVGGPRDARFLLQPEELRHAFAQLEILSYEEKADDKGLAQLVARKPLRPHPGGH